MPAPELSVVLTATESYAVIRKTMAHLARQTVAQEIELILVARSREELAVPEEEVRPFLSWRVVELKVIQSIGSANAAGIRAASAPVVALAEDHCFPEPDWAERLLAAHAGPWAVVGPAVKNANPGSAVSWADYFIGYGPWTWPCASREAEFLPGHNSSYKRDVLLSYGPELERMLEAETVLHWDLRAKGHRLYLDAGVQAAHTNYSRWSVWLKVQYLGGRMFGGSRVAKAPVSRRLMYFAASPLIPLIRLARVTQTAIRAGLWGRWLYCLPALSIGLTLDGIGQAAGYLCGPGDSMQRLAPYEFCRVHNVNERDRREVFGL